MNEDPAHRGRLAGGRPARAIDETIERPPPRQGEPEPPASCGGEPVPEHPRYVYRGVLGQGGQGIVFRVADAELGREVALKTLKRRRLGEEGLQAFVDECRAAANLEHPNIVPMYDAGRLADGRPYYTMRLVSGRTLGQVLAAEAETRRVGALHGSEWTIHRLVQVVQQACLALEHAHDRGVLHRDVKPSNILLGPFGEVLLVDWGIARSETSLRERTETGVVKGTACYMSPEQVRAGRLDARSDVYALGVVLYECLTLELPFHGESEAELLAAILRDAVPDPVRAAPDRGIPPELAALVQRALAKRASDRVPSARALHDELQAFLEGVRDRERRAAAAEDCRQRAEAALVDHETAVHDVARLRADVDRLELALPPHVAISEKRSLLQARAALVAAEDREQMTLLDAINGLTDALAHVPDHAAVRGLLADVFWDRFSDAERACDRRSAITFRSLVERFHDGRYAERLEGRGALRFTVRPEGAEVVLHPLVEEDLVLVDGPGTLLGRGDVARDDVPMGSYVVVASAPGFETARWPILVERSSVVEATLALVALGTIPAGMVHVPGGAVWLGGDAAATNSWPLRRVDVAPFAMSVFPVTFREYCDFLDHLEDHGGAGDRVPRTVTDGPFCVRSPGQGAWIPDPEQFAPYGLADSGCAPVVGVSRLDAEAFAAWASERTGRRLALPTAEQWEHAARGADRRVHPWGNRFDAALCLTREAVAGPPRIHAVGAFPADVSVHGVRDLAGGVQEWTASWFDAARRLAEVRGSGWAAGAASARGAWRGVASEGTRNASVGFRLVMSLE